MIVGIDASRIRSGGGVAHLLGIICNGNPQSFGIRRVHIWSYRKLLDLLPDPPWLEKHAPVELEKSLPKQLWWQAITLQQEASTVGCNLLFSTDASTLSRFRPMVVLGQDMLSYEPGVMSYFGFSLARLRLLAILKIQNSAFRFANGVVFLTKYAADVIQQSCGPLRRITYIPHGVGEEFRLDPKKHVWPISGEPIQYVYVSNAAPYKHQWVVVQAIELLRRKGHNVVLSLIGGGQGRAQMLLDQQIAASDPTGVFVEQLDFMPHSELPFKLAQANVFIFASSCENLPVTLLEAMAAGLPIACSDCGPMPEVLKDGGIYFNPRDPGSIAAALEVLINDSTIRELVAQRAGEISKDYTWTRCANSTWEFLSSILNG